MDPPENEQHVDPSTDGPPAVEPDSCEELLAHEIDNIVPTRGYQMTPERARYTPGS